MKKLLTIILTVLVCLSCKEEASVDSKQEYEKVETSALVDKEPTILVDKICVGMTIKEMKDIYKTADFIKEPVHKYGVDGESDGIVVQVDNKRLFFVWTLLGNDTIHGITILSEKIVVNKDLHVGMTLEEIMKKYPNSEMEIDMIVGSYEYVQIPQINCLLEFLSTDSTRVANYDYSKPSPKFIGIKIPKAKVDRISM